SLRCASSDALRPTAPSCSSDSSLLALPASATAHDVPIRRLVLLAGAVPEGGDTPRRDGVTPRSGGALASTVRVVDGVHGYTAGLGAHAHVALAPGLPDLDVLVLGVADRPDGRAALGAHHPHLAGGQAQRRHVAVLGHQLDRGTGGAGHLAAATGL